MKCTIIGMRKFQFVPKSGGEGYPALNIFVTYPAEKRKNDMWAEGFACESVFARADDMPDMKKGDEIEVLYNRFGSVEEIRVVTEGK